MKDHGFKNMTNAELWHEFRVASKPKLVFGHIYDRISPAVYTYCLKILASEDAAKDALQETCIKLYEARKNYDEMANLTGFAVRIARNICLNEKAKKSYSDTNLEDVEIVHHDSPYHRKQLSDILNLAIEELPEEFKEPLVLKEYMSMSYKEISEFLDVPLATVRIRIFRAKTKLKKNLKPYIDEIESIDFLANR
ncbi:MAG: RNA polymerase sigma factor RpoE [Candidatus Kapaibacteriales bacterium]